MTTPSDPFAPPPEGGRPAGPPPEGSQPGPPPGPPPAGAPGWGAPQGGGYGSAGGYGTGPAAPGNDNGLGTGALVVGILALLSSWLVIGGLLGIVAVILGIVGLGRVKRGQASNRGAAMGGIVLGALSILIAVAIVAAGAAFFSSDTLQEFADCVEQANGDRAAEQECERRFEQRLEDDLGG